MALDADCITGTADPNVVDPLSFSRPGKFSAEPGAHYDRVTDAWQYLIGDDLHVGFFGQASVSLCDATLSLSELMAETAGLVPGCEVLDVGCGTGNPAIYLGSKYGCRVVGISNSSVGVELAKAKARFAGVEGQVTFRVENGTATSFENGTFDRVWIMESSHLISEKDLLVKECARVLRKDGRAVLCDLVLRQAMPVRPSVALFHDLMVLEEVYGKSTMQFSQTYVEQFQAHGMSADARDISAQVLPTFTEWRGNAERHASKVSEILGEEDLKRFIRSCDIMTRLFQNGQLGYCMISATK